MLYLFTEVLQFYIQVIVSSFNYFSIHTGSASLVESQAGQMVLFSDPFGNHCQISSVDQRLHLKIVQ